MKLREQIKALVGGLVAGLGALVTALADASVAAQEWAVIGLAAVTAYGAVFGVRQHAALPQLSAKELMQLAEAAGVREREGR